MFLQMFLNDVTVVIVVVVVMAADHAFTNVSLLT